MNEIKQEQMIFTVHEQEWMILQFAKESKWYCDLHFLISFGNLVGNDW
jgi:hypothetical protein